MGNICDGLDNILRFKLFRASGSVPFTRNGSLGILAQEIYRLGHSRRENVHSSGESSGDTWNVTFSSNMLGMKLSKSRLEIVPIDYVAIYL